MRRLPLIAIGIIVVSYFVITGSNKTDSPHGKNLKISCSVCHTSSGWTMDKNSSFDHSETGFILTGQHTDISCRNCHPSLVFDETGSQCIDCHADMHQETVGQNCERCHSTQSWLVSNIFEIHSVGRFPLVGPHASADCEDCHKDASLLVFEPVDISCRECHMEDYLAASFPNHAEAGYSTSCEECHNIYSYEWAATGINHSFFPLVGGHDIADCAACHTTGDYKAISADCFSCHENDYVTTTNPQHDNAGFSTNCISCHSYEFGWSPATFDHNIFFPLTGVHMIEECASCHTSGHYADASSLCYSCHEQDYTSTENPKHTAAGFSTVCETCHSTETGWTPATFDHNQFFPLTGVHNIDACTECHNPDNYAEASSECFSCHERDFNSTTDPNHSALNFSTSCEICHSTTSGWTPSTFDHNSYFPIYSGNHKGEWNSCSDCHTNSSNYSIFSCTNCHEHNKNETDNNHDEVSNYVYESTACLSCHPRGEGDD